MLIGLGLLVTQDHSFLLLNNALGKGNPQISGEIEKTSIIVEMPNFEIAPRFVVLNDNSQEAKNTTSIPIVQSIGIKPPKKVVKVEEIILEKAKKYGVHEQLALELAKTESGLDPNARNKESTAKGLYQFVNQTFAGNCEGEVLNPEDNAECAMRMIANGGITHWTSSTPTREMLLRKGYVECIKICTLK